MRPQSFTRWAKNFDRWLARTQRLDVADRSRSRPTGVARLGPKRGGVSVELVAIVLGADLRRLAVGARELE